MRRCHRVVAACAVACALAVLLPALASAAAGEKRAIVALYLADPQDAVVLPPEGVDGSAEDTLLQFFDEDPTLAVGLWSSVQGTYRRQQVLLDITQGTRQPTGLYSNVDQDDDDVLDDLVFDGRTRRFGAWPEFRQRARDVSRTMRPGLLAGSVPGGAGFVGVRGEPALPALVAADERGEVAATSFGTAASLADRTRALLGIQELVVVAIPPGATGRAQIGRLARTRSADDLLMVVQLPSTPERTVGSRPPGRLMRQPAFAIGAGLEGSPTSDSTRQDGLVSATDLAPTVLEWLGEDVPDRMRGEAIEDGEAVSAARLDDLRSRWTSVRGGRQTESFTTIVLLAALLFLLIGTARGLRAAVGPTLRVGGLALLWWPSAVLLSAAVEPTAKTDEVFLIAGVSMALGAITARVLPWSRAPLLPAAVCMAAYTVDLALGGELLTRSVLGPSVVSGSRFYGVSNELEPILPIVLLVGLAALMTGRAVTRATTALYGAAGVALLIVIGWGRLGADVGGVITVGAGVAVATLVMLPGPVTVRRLLITAAVPVAALAFLIVIDIGLADGSHLSRNLLRADDSAELAELVTRRYELSWRVLTSGDKLPQFLGALLAVAFAWRNRERLYGALPHRAWVAALIGGLAAGVVGALTNDSGPVLFINAVVALAGLTAYLLSRPRPEPGPVDTLS